MKTVAIIGGGPAGLMAAERMAMAGLHVTVYERKPSLARKFLMAGRGGLNITHSENLADFTRRYGAAESFLAPLIAKFTPTLLRGWCEDLGEPTFIGSSGRVFPKSFKASPLLRAWHSRLSTLGVTFLMRHDWQGWDDAGDLVFKNAEGETKTVKPDATLLALGGASWPRLGADGSWQKILTAQGVPLSPLRASNGGFMVAWSDLFWQKFAGLPLKPVTLSFAGITLQGEIMITERGIEGGAVYALSAALRESIAHEGQAMLILDLRPGLNEAKLVERLSVPRQAKSFANFLRKQAALSPLVISLLRETKANVAELDAVLLARHIKSFPLTLTAPFPIDRAISTAGGIALEALDSHLMLKKKIGVFVAGEMLDWEAPTGGYLLQACFATGVAAAEGIAQHLHL